MSCCGGKRREWQASQTFQPLSSPAPEESGVVFEYVGPTGLSLRGPISGRPYRFDSPGARVTIDRRDAASIMAVPNVKVVSRAKGSGSS
jgi:hypothetical protein